MEQDPSSPVTLLTTFDLASGDIPEQNIPLSEVFEQARALNLDVCVVPSGEGKDGYWTSVLDGLSVVARSMNVSDPRRMRLFFGDLHLEDIRSWRENKFKEANYRCSFPLFNTPYPDLAAAMFGPSAQRLGARYFFSAVNNPGVGFKVGDEITMEVMEQHLMKSEKVDPFGESGEYHSVVRFAESL